MHARDSLGSMLSLAQYGVRFGDKVVLGSVDLEVPPIGPFVLLGPAGTGKSTLLRSLAGFNDRNPRFVAWGRADYNGSAVADGNRPALISQSARLVMATVAENLIHNLPGRRRLTPLQQRDTAAAICAEHGIPEFRDRLDETVVELSIAEQRTIALVRLAAAEPPLLCIDEPTTDLEDDEAERLLERIAVEAESRAVLVVLHNQRHARRLGGHCGLLVGGFMVESGSTADLLDAPTTEMGRRLVRTGTCHAPSPDADPEELAPEAPRPRPLPESAAPPVVPESRGPTGFLWLRPGRLAGTPLPGVVHPLEYDLDALQRMGVTLLVSLTQEPPDEKALRAHGIRVVSSPITDMCPPGLTQAWELCARIEKALADGEVIAVHCRAGLGRTGTILACFCVWEGMEALDALEEVRGIDARWVQSEEQLQFITQFAETVQRHGGTRQRG